MDSINGMYQLYILKLYQPFKSPRYIRICVSHTWWYYHYLIWYNWYISNIRLIHLVQTVQSDYYDDYHYLLSILFLQNVNMIWYYIMIYSWFLDGDNISALCSWCTNLVVVYQEICICIYIYMIRCYIYIYIL